LECKYFIEADSCAGSRGSKRLAAAREREALTEKQVQNRSAAVADLMEARLARLDIEIALARLPAK